MGGGTNRCNLHAIASFASTRAASFAPPDAPCLCMTSFSTPTAPQNAAALDSSGDALARRNALFLAAAQALAGGNASVLFATGAITGAMLAPQPSLATLPVSIFMAGMAAGTLPVGWISRVYGRRAAFVAGCLLGACFGMLAALAVYLRSFELFCGSTFLGGLYASVAQSYRFAAADTASDAFKPKAISWVLAGGVLAGVLGPQMVQVTMDMFAPYLFLASYLAQAGAALLALTVVWQVRLPPPQPIEAIGARPLRVIALQPRFIAAVICGVASYVLMNLLMTSAPLAMKMCGLPLSASNTAIQWHVVAMFGPSFFTGGLIARFGAEKIIAAGLALTAAAALTGMAGITVWHFWICLALLGLGWNFGFIGASAMVVSTHLPSERNKVQALNDFLVFSMTALGSFASGQVLTRYGWSVVNQVTFPPIALSLAALIVALAMARRTRLAAL